MDNDPIQCEPLIPSPVSARLAVHGAQIKALLPDLEGSVTFHLGRQRKSPKVEVRACDVTETKR